jgi:hypothetical protein
MKKMGSKTTEKLNCKDFTFEKNTRDNADTEHV